MKNKEKPTKIYMSAEETAMMLSQTMKNVTEKKTTLHHALTVSRIAMALAKIIEVVDLEKRIIEIERHLSSRDKGKH
jgi:hypothetical protein